MADKSLGVIRKELTLKEAGHTLRAYAELTASASQNWDAFENLAVDMIQQVHDHAKKEESNG